MDRPLRLRVLRERNELLRRHRQLSQNKPGTRRRLSALTRGGDYHPLTVEHVRLIDSLRRLPTEVVIDDVSRWAVDRNLADTLDQGQPWGIVAALHLQRTQPSFTGHYAWVPPLLEPHPAFVELYGPEKVRDLRMRLVGHKIERATKLPAKRPELGYCWLWNGAQRNKRSQYGSAYFAGRTWSAHRLVWTMQRGWVPAGLQLDHLCRETMCVNPAHLRVVTASVNANADHGWGDLPAARTHCPHGHEYTPENTRVSEPREGSKRKVAQRRCQTCSKAQRAARTERERQARQAAAQLLLAS